MIMDRIEEIRETCGITYHLDAYNAYDDKGNKIEGEYITLTKKEYDNIK